MNRDDVRSLFSYTEWANGRILESVRGLSEEQFTREIVSSFPSVRDTLAHIVMAEWIWLRRWLGESPMQRPEWALSAPSLETIATHLEAVQDERRALLDRVTDEELQRPIDYRLMNGEAHSTPLGDLMTHVANHATYHRGQLTTMLRQIGVTPPSTDMIVFIRNRR